jgi:2-dehydro-3-deoxyphosphooctonate aldolase (KDO 8-P synthase)
VGYAPRVRLAKIGAIEIGEGRDLVLIAGPCVVESERVMRDAARALVEIAGEVGVPVVFKSSTEKDNRGQASAYRGPGLEPGLTLLSQIRAEFGLPLLSDVHRAEDVPAAARVLDALQVPAFLCRQTSLLEAAGRSGRPVNLKKGQFMSPRAMAGSVEKVRRAAAAAGASGPSGSFDVLLTERGSTFGYDRLVSDLTTVPAMQALGCPVVFDAGHASNVPEEIPTLARAGVAAGADALFVECHPDPSSALCDGPRMLSLAGLRDLLAAVLPIARAVRDLRPPRR